MLQHQTAQEYWRRGAAYYERGQHVQAERCYLRALSGSETDTERGALLLNLGFNAEHLHNLDAALRYSHQACTLAQGAKRLECLARVAWLQLIMSDGPAARRTLRDLLSNTAGPLSEFQCRMLLAAFRHHRNRGVLRALQAADSVRQSRLLSAQLALILHPAKRRPRRADCHLHPILDPQLLDRIVIRPVLAGPNAVRFRSVFLKALEQLADFHRREFGRACHIESVQEIAEEFSLHALFDGTDADTHVRLLTGLRPRRGEVVLVGVGGQSGTGPLGFTVGRMSFINLARLLWCEALLVHEFYHAALDLEHTDGEAEVSDEASVMALHACLSHVNDDQRAACLTPERAFRQGLAADKLLQTGHFETAVSSFEAALELDGNQRWAVLRLAEAWAWRGHLGEMNRVLASPGSWARRARTRHLLAVGQRGAAAELMESLPSWQRAYLLYDAGHYRDASRNYRTDAQRGYAQDGMARCYVGQGYWQRAETMVRRRLQASPWSPSLYGTLAEVQAAQGHRDAAAEALRAARARTDRSAAVAEYRISVHRLLGEWSQAAALLRRMVKGGAVPTGPWLDLGYCQWRAGARSEALQACVEAVRAAPPPYLAARLAQAWVEYLSVEWPRTLGRRVAGLVRELPYSVPALHLHVLVCNDVGSARRLRRLSPRSLPF